MRHLVTLAGATFLVVCNVVAQEFNNTILKKSLSFQVEHLLGRARRQASLGHLGDFPTGLQDALDSYSLDVEVVKVREEVKSFKFRQDGSKRYVQVVFFFIATHFCTVNVGKLMFYYLYYSSGA